MVNARRAPQKAQGRFGQTDEQDVAGFETDILEFRLGVVQFTALNGDDMDIRIATQTAFHEARAQQ